MINPSLGLEPIEQNNTRRHQDEVAAARRLTIVKRLMYHKQPGFLQYGQLPLRNTGAPSNTQTTTSTYTELCEHATSTHFSVAALTLSSRSIPWVVTARGHALRAAGGARRNNQKSRRAGVETTSRKCSAPEVRPSRFQWGSSCAAADCRQPARMTPACGTAGRASACRCGAW